MSKSKSSRKDFDREEGPPRHGRPKAAKSKSAQRREERALKTGDLEPFYQDEVDEQDDGFNDFYEDRR